MELHRRHAFEPLPAAFVTVEIEIMLDFWNYIVTRSELSQVVHLGFEDPPEAFHWPVVNTSADVGHALPHIGCSELGVKDFARVLKSSVTVKQRVSIRICPYRLVKRFKYKRIIVAVSNLVWNNPPVVQIKDSTQLHFLNFSTYIVF